MPSLCDSVLPHLQYCYGDIVATRLCFKFFRELPGLPSLLRLLPHLPILLPDIVATRLGEKTLPTSYRGYRRSATLFLPHSSILLPGCRSRLCFLFERLLPGCRRSATLTHLQYCYQDIVATRLSFGFNDSGCRRSATLLTHLQYCCQISSLCDSVLNSFNELPGCRRSATLLPHLQYCLM